MTVAPIALHNCTASCSSFGSNTFTTISSMKNKTWSSSKLSIIVYGVIFSCKGYPLIYPGIYTIFFKND